jgi:hypothetical protein
MKTISIKKNNEFSANSRVYVHSGSKRIHVIGYEPITLQVEPGQEFYGSQLWTQSNRLEYDQINDNSKFLIKPRLGKILAFVILVVFAICTVIFLFTRWRWSYVPLFPFVIYVGLYLSLLKNSYLILQEEK